MSYDKSLVRECDNKIIEEDQIVREDHQTVVLKKSMKTSDSTVVRINDFRRLRGSLTETLIMENVSDQFDGTNRIIYVTSGPIYNGLKLAQYATHRDDVTVKMKVVDEDVSEQLTGTEDYFITQGIPLIRSKTYDFNTEIEVDDIEVKINGDIVEDADIVNIEPISGRVQLSEPPLVSDTVTISYYFKAKIDELDAVNSKIVIKETPAADQEVTIQYFTRNNNGWYTEKNETSLIENALNIIFFEKLNTQRTFIEREDVSSYFTGTENEFFTVHSPLLPLNQSFVETPADTLNNAIIVWINNEPVKVTGVDPETGWVKIVLTPHDDDLVEASYYYEADVTQDKISVDYVVDPNQCDKCKVNSDLIDYTLNPLGKYNTVRGIDKLLQDLKKMIKTVLGSDTIASWYGTNLETMIGTKQIAEFVETKITGEIVNTLETFKTVQIKQAEYQEVTDQEFLEYIESVIVTQNETEPLLYNIQVNVVNKAGQMDELKDEIRLQ